MKVDDRMVQSAINAYARPMRGWPAEMVPKMRAALEAVLEPLPEPGSTIIELNKRVRALQIKLQKARNAGFVVDPGDE